MTPYPCVRQAEGEDCGAAVLSTVARYFGKQLSLEHIREAAETDGTGTTLFGLEAAAQSIGFKTWTVKGGREALHQIPLPAIVHLQEDGSGHFVVVHRVGGRRAVIADPAAGVRRVGLAELERQWTGYLLLLTPGDEFESSVPATSSSSLGRRVLKLLRPHRGTLAKAFMSGLVFALFGLATSLFLQYLVDTLHSRAGLLDAVALGMVGLVGLRSLGALARGRLLARMGKEIDRGLLAAYADKVLSLRLRYFDRRQPGEILSRADDAARIRRAVAGTSLTLALDSVFLVTSAGAMFFYDLHLASIAIALVPVFVLVVGWHHREAVRRARREMERRSRLRAGILEDCVGMETVKAFSAEETRLDADLVRLREATESSYSVETLRVRMTSLGLLLNGGAGALILWYGAYRVTAGTISVGQLVFFYSLLGFMLTPLERLAGLSLQIQDALVALERYGEIMDLPAEALGETGGSELPGVHQGIRFEGVSFSYRRDMPALQGVSLEVPAGSLAAIVGPSGSGKTTLLKLIARFYEPSVGRISIDGLELRDYSLRSLRKRIGLVSQEPFVFDGSVRDNIALGRPEASMAEVVEAARLAALHDFVLTLPGEYDARIGSRGTRLSGGQRQRLAIARALLVEPDILLFDEATSHLDARTEQVVRENLRHSFAGKTVIVVAHRLSTVIDADTLFVLDQGKVVETGSHPELLARRGRYWELVRAQLEDAASSQAVSFNHLGGVVEGARLPTRSC